MKNLARLLRGYAYKVEYSKSRDPATLVIVPKNGQGLPITFYGTFADRSLRAVNLTNIAMPGLAFDFVNDHEIDENLTFAIAKAILEGRFSYILKSTSILNRLTGGTLYISIGDKREMLVDNFKCVGQKELKKMYQRGQLKTVAYKRLTPPSNTLANMRN